MTELVAASRVKELQAILFPVQPIPGNRCSLGTLGFKLSGLFHRRSLGDLDVQLLD